MKVKEFTAIGKQLLPLLPGFVVEKDLIFRSPVDDVLQGLCFERCSDPKHFHLWVLFLPLYVPRDSVRLTHGRRIGNALNWRANNLNLLSDLNEAVRREAVPFLNGASTLPGVIKCLSAEIEIDRQRASSHVLEALAYTMVKTGDCSSALEWLAELKRILIGDTVPWVVEQLNRAQLIERKLLQNPQAALAQLDAWKAETVANLGLGKYCSQSAEKV